MENEAAASYHTVCRVDDVPEGEARMFVVAEIMIGVFNVAGSFFALANECPHAGASLARGIIEGDTVRCRIHHWRFSIPDGVYLDDVSFDVELATGEFASTLGYARQITNGQITQGLDGLLWTGHILDVLSRIDAISQDGRTQPGLFWPTLRLHDVPITSAG